jgi:heme exporter protein CcmD
MGGGGNKIVIGEVFWSMGGYARYVWPCFACAGVILGWNLWSARRYRVAAQLRARRALEAADADVAAPAAMVAAIPSTASTAGEKA